MHTWRKLIYTIIVNKIIKLLTCIALCETVGILGAVFTTSSVTTWYPTLVKPVFSPPSFLFAPVWTTLYFFMGIALFLIWNSKGKSKQKQLAIKIFLVQLFLNFLWSFLFFGLQSPILGFIDIVLLLAAIVISIKKFYPLSKWAAYLLIPYLLWVSFAAILNLSLVMLD